MIPSRIPPSSGPTSSSKPLRSSARIAGRDRAIRWPMPIDILMPALSPTMEKGKLAKWLKNEGDRVKSGDIIAEIETDKATMEVEAVDEGMLAKILVPDGTDDVAVNTPIAVLAADGEDPAPWRSERASAPRAAAHADAPAAPRRIRPGEARRTARPGCRRRLPTAGAYDASAEIPAGTEMVTMTVREALRDAMAEEMRRDGNVFVIGEEVAEYQGAYKVTQGLLQEFGPRRVVDTPITEHGFAGLAVGAALDRPEADRRVHDLQLRHAGDRPDHQLGGQDALHVRRPDGLPDRVPRPERRRPRASRAQHSQDYSAWYSHVPA